jgi:hypothetical protein
MNKVININKLSTVYNYFVQYTSYEYQLNFKLKILRIRIFHACFLGFNYYFASMFSKILNRKSTYTLYSTDDELGKKTF